MRNFKSFLATPITTALALASLNSAAAAKRTVALAHGAFAESSDWNGVAAQLL